MADEDAIKVESKAHKRAYRQLDYVLVGGEVYEVCENDFMGEVHLLPVDAVPVDYYKKRGEK